MGFIEDVKKCINNKCEVIGTDKNFLVENKTKPQLKIALQTEGPYLLYNFELLKDVFPFFSKTNEAKGLNVVADYVVFTEKGGRLWCVVIELKRKNGDPRNQLSATKEFVFYLVDSVNRHCKKKYDIEMRGIAYSRLTRPKTNLKKPFDINFNAFLTGDKINLTNFLI